MKNLKQILHAAFCLLFLYLPVAAQAQNYGTWTWMHGSDQPNNTGHLGIQGIASPANCPGAVYEPVEFTDLQGNFWVYGGSLSCDNCHDCLWKFDPSTNMWTWMKGTINNTTSVNGIKGIPSPLNTPGERGWGAQSWTDTSGNLWLFGGASSKTDFWKYDISTNEWTWMAGDAVFGSYHYGLLQLPDAANCPPSIWECASTWTDNNGNLWVFGGVKTSAFNLPVDANDMWKFNPSTNIWTWMSGDSLYSTPNYGTKGIPASSNTPGGRCSYTKWKDTDGNFWIFGGDEVTSEATYADMWKYDISTNLWTWMAGSNIPDDQGNFTQKCAAGNEYPASRFENRCGWTDDCGRFFNYGGAFDLFYFNTHNDLWMFDPSNCLFTWVGGDSQATSQPGVYGSLLVPAPTNYPAAAGGNVGFKDKYGNFWMFGGVRIGDTIDMTNSLWKYTPDPSCTRTAPLTTLNAHFSSSDSGCAPLTMSFTASPENPSYSYLWDFGENGNSANASTTAYTYSEAGNYTVTLVVTANSSCDISDTLSKTITVENCEPPPPLLEMPNVFTPNGDGQNDNYLPIKMENIENATLMIFNRWGQKIFETTDLSQGWNGKHHGLKCADGTYYWIVEYTGADNKKSSQQGFVMLLR
ncbi:MAG: gliding motility-associated C-terminal domain-containing protein [Bacteroidota bacterium]